MPATLDFISNKRDTISENSNSEAMEGAPLTDQPQPSHSARDVATAIGIAILILLVCIACTVTFFIIRRRRMGEAGEPSKAPDVESKIHSLTAKAVARKPVPISKSSPTGSYQHPSTWEDDLFKSYLERPLPAHPVH
jgi:hypothetical protein